MQEVIIYDKYDSCVNRVKPCLIQRPNLLTSLKGDALQKEMYVDNFENQHGSVKRYWLVYINKSKHDTYYFEKLLKEGKKKYEK